MPTAYTYSGSQVFKLVGSGRHEDTLRIETNSAEKERLLQLTLPTLCITYANMEFANKIGGEQKNFPDSASYGPAYFQPPVVITGAAKIEQLTWIRGANQVVIGPDRTEIRWPPWRTLVIPRLRIAKEKPADGMITVNDFTIPAGQELVVNVLQYADGRHVGGVRIAKRHPEWKPPQIEPTYDLWLRVLDGATLRPLPEAWIRVFRWDPRRGRFNVTDKVRTDGEGATHFPKRMSDELEAVVVQVPGCQARVHCFRPLAGQQVRLHIPVWRLKESVLPYTWREGSRLRDFAALTGYTSRDILKRNGLKAEREIKVDQEIVLPCWAGSLWLEQGESLERIAKTFAFGSVKELVKANGVRSAADVEGRGQVLLPGWHFFHARKGETLPKIDALFGVPAGCSRTVARVHRPDARVPFESEAIAVPTLAFVKKNAGNF